MTARRAVVLFVPPPVSVAIDEIRMRWDPVMCARIGAHITLVHDVMDHDRARRQVAAAAAATTPFVVTLTGTDHWGRSAHGVYLHIDDPSGGIAGLQAQLADLEDARWARVPFRAHCTLVHSRTTEATVAARAWAELEDFHAGWDVDVSSVDIIEMDEATGWCSIEQFALTRATLVAD